MTREERFALIDRYAEGYAAVVAALAGFPADRRGAHPIPGKWSAAEIVHHLADSESVAAGRIRTLLAEERPTIHAYDQEAWAAGLRYAERDPAPALDLLRAVRANTVPLLRSLTDAQWQRAGTHTESGPYSAEDWLRIYAEHAHKHAGQIVRLRETLAAGAPAAG